MTRLKEIGSELKKSQAKKTKLKKECHHPKIIKLDITQTEVIAFLDDQRKASIPIDWFKKWGHKDIKPEQLKKYEVWGGYTIYWPNIDAHVGVEVFTDGLKNLCCDYH